MKQKSLHIFKPCLQMIFVFSFVILSFGALTRPALSADCCSTCNSFTALCGAPGCGCQSTVETPTTISHITDELREHQTWWIEDLWDGTVLPSMLLMTEELSTVAYQQINIIGTFFDAKHQLETQRLFQELVAQAHKDYHPSEGMCQFGTMTRTLAASTRNAEFNQVALSAQSLQRQLLAGNTISVESEKSDSVSRLVQYREVYCNPADNSNGLGLLCSNGSTPQRYNKDVHYHNTIADPLTLQIDFTPDADGDHTARGATADEEDVMALSSNLYGHKILQRIPGTSLDPGPDDDEVDGALLYLDSRALAAKRSVAQSAFAAQAAMRSQGEPEVYHYLETLLESMGVAPDVTLGLVGDRPSYHAQMEILTKKIYQNPRFYTELYDKPVNIDRKEVAMRAIGSMQKRDMYRSLLRSEAIMSVWLETQVDDLQEFYTNEAGKAKDEGVVIPLP